MKLDQSNTVIDGNITFEKYFLNKETSEIYNRHTTNNGSIANSMQIAVPFGVYTAVVTRTVVHCNLVHRCAHLYVRVTKAVVNVIG